MVDKNKVFQILQAGRGTVNPLSDIGAVAGEKTQSVVSGLSQLQNPSALKAEALRKAGIDSSYINMVQLAMDGNLSSISTLVAYGDESVQNMYSRINIAKNYAAAMDKFGVATACTPFNSVMGIVGGIGQRVLNTVTEAVGGAADSIAEFLGLDDTEDLLAKAQELKATLDGAFESVATFVKDVTDYINEEALLLKEYMTTAINSALTEVLGDWVDGECTSAIMDTILSPEVRQYL
ncbi:hypothetical protein [Escherichia phage vB_EcoM_IME392]|nr:hypothetical protein [Escherichia phage vB_EcoM_IME392]